MKVRVRQSESRVYELTVQPSTTVRAVQEMLSGQIGTNKYLLHIAYGDQDLTTNALRTMAECGIADGTELNLTTNTTEGIACRLAPVNPVSAFFGRFVSAGHVPVEKPKANEKEPPKRLNI